ncbi:MAG: ATP-dependent zinc metalloprotease FtsH [Oligoflexales bacterium]
MKPPHQSQNMKAVALVVVILMFFSLMHMLSPEIDEVSEITYSEFQSAIELPSSSPDKIIEASFKENTLTGVRVDRSKVHTYVPNDVDTRKYLSDHSIVLNFESPDQLSWWKSALIQAVPMLLILGIFIFFMRSLQAGGGRAMSFGKSRARLTTDHKPKVTFSDIAGIDEAKQELQEIIEFLREPKKFTKLGGRIPKGVLLVGGPGTGKTILAKGVAGEAEVPFFSISGSDFVEMFVGVGASRVRDLFEQAKKNAPCIVFIDEIDAVGRHRGAGMGGGHDEREQTLNQLLVEMDGFDANEGVIVVAATNRADVLDPALLRPGRFDRRVHVPAPDIKGRKAILKVHSRKTPMANDVDIAKIAQGTPGFTGADLENLINESALIAARKNCTEVSMNHFELAKDKVIMGAERRSMIMSEDEKRSTAYHEAGHALVGLKQKALDPVHKVSIIPRGRALGVTIMLPESERFTMSKEYAEGRIAYAMGGRAAEELIFQEHTTGAGDDIRQATDIARKMICQWGMSETIGPVAIGRRDGEEVFVGRGTSSGDECSEQTSQLVDAEVQRLLKEGYDKAMNTLKEYKSELEKIAEALLIKETLDAKEMNMVLNGENIVSEEDSKAYAQRLEASRVWREEGRDIDEAPLNPEPQPS